MAEKRMTDAERLERIKRGLKCSDAEARDVLAYDKDIDKRKDSDLTAEHDLSPEQQKIAQKFAHAGTRKAPTAYKFTKRQRKPNATKAGIIAELVEFLTNNSQFEIADLKAENPERLITFKVGENPFTLTLTQNRKK